MTFAREHLRESLQPYVRPGQVGQAGLRQVIQVGKVTAIYVTASSYYADVEVTYRGTSVVQVIRNVQFNVPASVGDAVSLEFVNGTSLGGVFGTPLRPKGANAATLSQPTDYNDGNYQPESAMRAANAAFDALVLPLAAGVLDFVGGDNRTPLLVGAGVDRSVFTLLNAFAFYTHSPTIVVTISYKITGGWRNNGMPGPVRVKRFPLEIWLRHRRPVPPFAPRTISLPVTQSLGVFSEHIVGEYDMGADIEYGREYAQYTSKQVLVGDARSVFRLADFPEWGLDWVGRPVDLVLAVPSQPNTNFDYQFYDTADLNWGGIPNPSNSGASLWLGLRGLELTIAELGTGNA